MSRYKTLKTMMDKMNAQLNLAAKIRAVDEADVAYKVIERHFLPDILGNLKAFSKQSVRCPTCNITRRRKHRPQTSWSVTGGSRQRGLYCPRTTL